MIVYHAYLKYVAFAVATVTFPIIGLIVLKIIQKFTTGRCKSLVCLNGKTAIVTGGGSGIGFETALQLASRGCRVIIADREDATKTKNKIIDLTNNTNIETKHLDLTSFQSIRRFAKEINETEDRLDILINNAGAGSVGNKHTDDGLHITMQVNHFGPFLLTHLLADLLKKSAPSRIIFVSSATAFFWNNLTVKNLNYPSDHPMTFFRSSFIYGNSKLCNIIAANGFAERLSQFGVTSNSLHPGLVNTEIHLKSARILGIETFGKLFANTILYLYGKSPKEGAQTTIALAVSNHLQNVTGKHFWDCRTFIQPPKAWNRKFCTEIWEKSEELTKLKPEEKL
ncbi:retinol dehydrogenase 13 [Tribolium castaneum]|uniref:WW domain-containing oxidoreductase-like Protein n=1 Tax=Tribolium castaneum TaxID=7070 RepID=D7EHT8_TRICA|nr:PREDICTED: retinol dehydrogenase 13-like isoform X1 [Tribolium castaneum]EFA12116.1 WW domain-containing oxidoreductase-like Protein [Tribolium castaneum]|eukprot:XP_008199132.2 PREDICTED: retinol dehydrogenase 13-like isoform X1 [Tribolium castaneum]